MFVFIVPHHERRRILHFGVTAHPSLLWASQQIREAFPWDTAPRYLIRDRDGSYGTAFRSRLQAMGVEEVLIAPRSPWQNAYAKRVIGSIRRECLDHVIVLNEGHLRRILQSYCNYYHRSRTHLSLAKDCPEPRRVQPPGPGTVIAFPQVGGLHHRYERLAAGTAHPVSSPTTRPIGRHTAHRSHSYTDNRSALLKLPTRGDRIALSRSCGHVTSDKPAREVNTTLDRSRIE